ncbi:MAG: chorismate synthase [Salinivirgaceae bacterium]|nr:chorismate synthase [Salinivirgaceae bacterium]
MNTFGRIFRVSIFGESHGAQVGVVIDGCPAGIALEKTDFDADLARRKSGAKGTTPRTEADEPEIVSGVFNGHTTGTPITILFKNSNTHSSDYANLVAQPRPGHADFTGRCKYQSFNDYRGGGHFSARITVGIVAAGVVAKKILEGIDIKANIREVGGQTDIEVAVERAMAQNDSIGGIVDCRVTGLPVGLGEPFWDSVESLISHAVFAIPAVKGIEFGSGFKAAQMLGSEHNDAIIDAKGTTATNNAGGINGGITNGNELYFSIAVKPTSSISREQQTFNFETGKVEPLQVRGRHDACIALRVPPILEAMTAIVLADLKLIAKAIKL